MKFKKVTNSQIIRILKYTKSYFRCLDIITYNLLCKFFVKSYLFPVDLYRICTFIYFHHYHLTPTFHGIMLLLYVWLLIIKTRKFYVNYVLLRVIIREINLKYNKVSFSKKKSAWNRIYVIKKSFSRKFFEIT